MKRLVTLVASLAFSSLAFSSLAVFGSVLAQQRTITVASTTSTEQSGLFGYLLPRFTSATGIGVKVVAVGTRQELALRQRGDARVVVVDDKVAGQQFPCGGICGNRSCVVDPVFVVG